MTDDLPSNSCIMLLKKESCFFLKQNREIICIIFKRSLDLEFSLKCEGLL